MCMGENGMKKLEELSASCIESDQTNLFQFNPKMSYPDPGVDQGRSFLEAEGGCSGEGGDNSVVCV